MLVHNFLKSGAGRISGSIDYSGDNRLCSGRCFSFDGKLKIFQFQSGGEKKTGHLKLWLWLILVICKVHFSLFYDILYWSINPKNNQWLDNEYKLPYFIFTWHAVYSKHHSVYNWPKIEHRQVSDLRFQCHFSHLLLCLTVWHACTPTATYTHARTRTHALRTNTHPLHSGTHALLDFEALRPSCPSFQTLSRQEKNLGHQLSSLNLSITVTLDQWCRTHPSSPAGPRRTGLARSSPSYRCQESQLTACCCSWFQFVGPAMGRCQQSVLWQWVAVW